MADIWGFRELIEYHENLSDCLIGGLDPLPSTEKKPNRVDIQNSILRHDERLQVLPASIS
jgi:hypothetical protein